MWSDVYRETVLAPDYAFARAHLLPHLFDGLTAHALMLAACGVAGADRAAAALQALRRAPFPEYDPHVEDVFFALDRELSRLDAGAAGALRTALSRNDLDMTIYRMSARERLLQAAERLDGLRGALLALAEQERDTVIVAFTHHQPAQPTTLGHYLSGLENVLSRDAARFLGAWGRLNLSPMGAVALAGTGFPIDRALTARLLAFDAPIENTYDAVATSDWQVELAGAVVTAATTLSRAVHDLLFWASRGLLTLADGLVQGSSVMPQKRNPVALEHARTKLGKALGAAQGVMLSAHNVPFGDINDPGTDVQPSLHDLWRAFGEALELITASLAGLRVNRDAWLHEAASGEAAVTELADTLAARSGDFRAAHAAVKALLADLHAQGRGLGSAEPADLTRVGVDLPEADLRAALDPRAFVARRGTLGGPAPEALRAYLDAAGARLQADGAARGALLARLNAARAALEGVSTPSGRL